MNTTYKPGTLLSFRGRDWVVLPNSNPSLLMLKPVGGSDDEITAVFLPLNMPGDEVKETKFPDPSINDLHNFASARMLYEATRLSFRNASGPFRCMGKLSFRPRSYQVVPLVMALKQDVVRLLVADDVGVGKTIEALMIVKEMIERGEIKRFAIVCLPHLCEQWQQELKDKLDIDAEIIRSSTAASLDRKFPDYNRSVFYQLPYQVISIDYIKTDKRRGIFLADCPELVVVDEAHTCAKPVGASASQQQRYSLLNEIAKKEKQHLLLLTATPHSGKDEEFQSLLGLLNKDFEKYDLNTADQSARRKIAGYFIQRKRENIAHWHRGSSEEKTPFPERESKEVAFNLSNEYYVFYNEVLRFARGISQEGSKIKSTTIRYWAALALLRGVMSSPAAGYEMLLNRQHRKMDDEELDAYQLEMNPNFEKLVDDTDTGRVELLDNADFAFDEVEELKVLSEKIRTLYGLEHDTKAKETLDIVRGWIKEGYNPIIFCKYIYTANYIGSILKENLPAKIRVEVLTSELADEQRREKIAAMEESPLRVMVATDCLSEGINLQELFTAVLHYDLPWNPNRIEQREGRVDRFGQQSAVVKTCLLWGKNNPIDDIVLKILIRKVNDIKKAIGVSIPIGENNMSIMDAVIKDVLLTEKEAEQLSLFQADIDAKITSELSVAKEKAINIRDIFAHNSIDPNFINQNLDEIDEAIGDVQSVENFVTSAIVHLGGSVTKDTKGYLLYLTNLPEHLTTCFAVGKPVKVSFASPTPPGYRYIGRNHHFVELLCQFILSLAIEKHHKYDSIARASVIRTKMVEKKTTLIQFRVRNVIKEVSSSNEVISEEMYLWGYRGSDENAEVLSYNEAKILLLEAESVSNMTSEMQQNAFAREVDIFKAKSEDFKKVAENRAVHLVEAHGRFKELVGGKRYEAVHPVLPPDIMGVYILMPVVKG